MACVAVGLVSFRCCLWVRVGAFGPALELAKHNTLVAHTAYIAQYLPATAYNLMNQIGPRRARAIHAGQGGYDAKALTQRLDWLAVLGMRQTPRPKALLKTE